MLDECLSCLSVVIVKHQRKVEALRWILLQEVLNGSSNKDHNWYTVEVSKIEVVDASFCSPALDKDGHVTENSHYLVLLFWWYIDKAIFDFLRLQITIETFSAFYVLTVNARLKQEVVRTYLHQIHILIHFARDVVGSHHVCKHQVDLYSIVIELGKWDMGILE